MIMHDLYKPMLIHFIAKDIWIISKSNQNKNVAHLVYNVDIKNKWIIFIH